MPIHPGGQVVQLGRRAYTTTMNFYRDRWEPVTIRWYRTDPGARYFPHYNKFASRDYSGRFWFQQIGETQERPVWQPFLYNNPYTGNDHYGAEEIWEEGADENSPTTSPDEDGVYRAVDTASAFRPVRILLSIADTSEPPIDVAFANVNINVPVADFALIENAQANAGISSPTTDFRIENDVAQAKISSPTTDEGPPPSSCCSGTNPAVMRAVFPHAPSNGACSSCAAFPLTYDMQFVSDDGNGRCVWEGSYADPCSGLTETITLTLDGQFHTLTMNNSNNAAWFLSGTFDCQDTNPFVLLNSGPACSNWPSPVDVAALP